MKDRSYHLQKAAEQSIAESALRDKNRSEWKELFEDNRTKEIQREVAYKQRFERSTEKQHKNEEQYRQYLMGNRN